MAMKDLLSKTLLSKRGRGMSKSYRRQDSKCASALLNDETQKTSTTDESSNYSAASDDVNHPGWFESAFFREELVHVRYHTEITKVTFKDFVQRYERDDLLGLADIFKAGNRRHWQAIKFQDTILGTNYRRWQFKKENLRRAVDQALKNAGLRDKFPIRFDEHLEVNMDEMSRQAIVSLLREVQKDHHVTSICLDGFIAHQDVESIVGILITLLKKGHIKSVVFRCSFDGEDFSEWNRKIQQAKRRLEDVTIKQEIPLGFHVC